MNQVNRKSMNPMEPSEEKKSVMEFLNLRFIIIFLILIMATIFLFMYGDYEYYAIITIIFAVIYVFYTYFSSSKKNSTICRSLELEKRDELKILAKAYGESVNKLAQTHYCKYCGTKLEEKNKCPECGRITL